MREKQNFLFGCVCIALATLIFFVILALLLVTNLSDRSGEDVETSPRKKRRQKKHSPS